MRLPLFSDRAAWSHVQRHVAGSLSSGLVQSRNAMCGARGWREMLNCIMLCLHQKRKSGAMSHSVDVGNTGGVFVGNCGSFFLGNFQTAVDIFPLKILVWCAFVFPCSLCVLRELIHVL